MKGADVVMQGIVQYNDWLEEEVGSAEEYFCQSFKAPEIG